MESLGSWGWYQAMLHHMGLEPNHSGASERSWAEPATSTNHQSEVPQEALGDPEHSFDMLLIKHTGIKTELDLFFCCDSTLKSWVRWSSFHFTWIGGCLDLLCRFSSALLGWVEPFLGLFRDVCPGSSQDSNWSTFTELPLEVLYCPGWLCFWSRLRLGHLWDLK